MQLRHGWSRMEHVVVDLKLGMHSTFGNARPCGWNALYLDLYSHHLIPEITIHKLKVRNDVSGWEVQDRVSDK